MNFHLKALILTTIVIMSIIKPSMGFPDTGLEDCPQSLGDGCDLNTSGLLSTCTSSTDCTTGHICCIDTNQNRMPCCKLNDTTTSTITTPYDPPWCPTEIFHQACAGGSCSSSGICENGNICCRSVMGIVCCKSPLTTTSTTPSTTP